MDDTIGESKLVYEDSENRVRVLRGTVSIHGDLVKVERRDGVLYVPLTRVVSIEAWHGGREAGR